MKINFRLFVIIAAAVCIVFSAFTATYVVVTHQNANAVSPSIGDIDLEKQIVYVGYGDLVYETADSVPVLGRAVEFFDEFSGAPEAVIVGLHYEAIVDGSIGTGRFQVTSRDGRSMWIEPSWKVFHLDNKGRIESVPLEDAIEAQSNSDN